MHKHSLAKPDGRSLTLYGRQPVILAGMGALLSRSSDAAPPHLRWHPLRGEWVAYASGRQNRTFLPPAAYNPLAPSSDESSPTELPPGQYDVAVFDNLFPTFIADAAARPDAIVETRPALGVAEVVVFTQDPAASLGQLPLDHVELVIDVWADRQRELGARPGIDYVFPFENRGVEVGVTLPHSHGQIYAFPFVPPAAARELQEQLAYWNRHGRGLLEDLVAAEIRDGCRMLYEGEAAAAFVPVCARYPYEVWIAPVRAAESLADLDAFARADLARALKMVLLKLDGLWGRPFPYVLVIHQAPTDGISHPEAHLHLELYPAYRMPGRLKYLAGCELGAGVFTADTLPEEKAAELRAVEVSLD